MRGLSQESGAGCVAAPMRKRLVILLALAASAVLPATAGAAGAVPEGAEWSEATIPSTDGVKLHADILRPRDLPRDAKTPVILSIGPYFNHSGQVGVAGPVEDAAYDPVGPPGPSDRFKDFVDGAKLMRARLHVRDGRPARLRRLLRLPRLGRPRRAGRRRQSRRVGRGPAVVDRQGRHVRQVLRRRHRPARRQPAAERPGGGRLPGAGLRPLPLPLAAPASSTRSCASTTSPEGTGPPRRPPVAVQTNDGSGAPSRRGRPPTAAATRRRCAPATRRLGQRDESDADGDVTRLPTTHLAGSGKAVVDVATTRRTPTSSSTSTTSTRRDRADHAPGVPRPLQRREATSTLIGRAPQIARD